MARAPHGVAAPSGDSVLKATLHRSQGCLSVATAIEFMMPSWTKTSTLAKATPAIAAAKRVRLCVSCSQPIGRRTMFSRAAVANVGY